MLRAGRVNPSLTTAHYPISPRALFRAANVEELEKLKMRKIHAREKMRNAVVGAVVAT